MTPGDTVRVLTACAMFDHRRIGEADAAAWHAVIGDLDVADALEAVRRHYRDSTERAMPAHIRQQVRTIREERRRGSALALCPPGTGIAAEVNVGPGLATARGVVAALTARMAAKRTPPPAALDSLHAITAGPPAQPEEADDDR